MNVRDCAHCGAPVAGAVADPAYCCAGCEAVAELIAANGWDRFYERRDGYSPRPVLSTPDRAAAQEAAFLDEAAYQARWSAAEALEEGRVVMRSQFRVSGLRCAACVWLCERALEGADGVVDATVSYGTGIATVRWAPEATSLSQVAANVVALGYGVAEPSAPRTRNRAALVRLGVAAFCATNVMLIHATLYLGEGSGDMAPRHAALFAWASLALSTPPALYSAQPFYRGLWAALKSRTVSMDVPLAVAVMVMYVHGVFSVLNGEGGYLDSLTMLIALLLAGRLVVSGARERAARAAESVLALAPRRAHVRTGDTVREVDAAELQPGDVMVVSSGDAVAADARVVGGAGQLDLAVVTGESDEVAAGLGVEVPAGASLRSGQLELEVIRPASASHVARIERRVREALSARSAPAALADRVAPWFTLAVLVAATSAFAGWALSAGVGAGMSVAVAVLVVACPCALSLAGPATLAAAVGAAARRGAFVRSPNTLLEMGAVEVVAIDKTGTVTGGAPAVTGGSDEALALAAALELGNRHPVARAIVHAAEERRLATPRAHAVAALADGVAGAVDGVHAEVRAAGPGCVRVTRDGELVDEIRFADRIRPEARDTLAGLGREVVMLSGDHPDVVSRIAGAAGVSTWRGAQSPEQKQAWVAASSGPVMFVGDGVNDAPALAASHVGVAMGEGAAAAVETADVVVLESSLAPVRAVVATGEVAARVLKQNAVFAVVYNALAVGLAAAGLIGPLGAVLLMPLSSLTVIGNALSVERRVRRRLAAPTQTHDASSVSTLRPQVA